jgi:hypothetical protein
VDERLRRGQERRLIFENVANGVPIERIMAAFRRSREEVNGEVEFVGRKIREARFRTRMPPLDCQGPKAIRWNRRPLLDTLRQLTDEYLASDLLIPRIGVQDLDSLSVIREAAQRVRARVTG